MLLRHQGDMVLSVQYFPWPVDIFSAHVASVKVSLAFSDMGVLKHLFEEKKKWFPITQAGWHVWILQSLRALKCIFVCLNFRVYNLQQYNVYYITLHVPSCILLCLSFLPCHKKKLFAKHNVCHNIATLLFFLFVFF